MSKTIVHTDGLARCPWPKQDPLYVAYHDDEWGVPEYDDRALFEKLNHPSRRLGILGSQPRSVCYIQKTSVNDMHPYLPSVLLVSQ